MRDLVQLAPAAARGYNSLLCTKSLPMASTHSGNVLWFRQPGEFQGHAMAALDRPVMKPRPVYLNLLAIRMPLPAVVSILHRASGALLFLVGIPLLLCVVQRSLASPDAWAQMRMTLDAPLAKIMAIVLAWGFIHHLLAGIRHLLMDAHIGVELPAARQTAALTMVLAIILTLAVAVRLW
jgi:succinate dehydrogenase / fumarate reductase, cytochrome b subunit